MEAHDVIVIGGGHNGLTVAAYLAKAGVDVMVVEKNDIIGGSCASAELTLPGFRHERGAIEMIFMQASPLLLKDELGLMSQYGIEWIDLPVPGAFVYDDGTAIFSYPNLEKTCESIAGISPADADSYYSMVQSVSPMLNMLVEGLFNPPPSLTGVMSMLDSDPAGKEFIRAMFSSPFDLANEYFEHEKVKLWITRHALETTTGPKTKGTGMGVMLFGPMSHTYPQRIPKGGSSKVPFAFGRCIEDHGGTIRTNALVTKVEVENGRATCVVLDNGEKIRARKAIISNLDPRPLFTHIVEGTPDSFKKRLRVIQGSEFSIVMVHFALNEQTHWHCEEVNEQKPFAITFGTTMQDMLEEYADISLGRSKKTLSGLCIPVTWWDPGRAPEGKHIFQYGSHELYTWPDWDHLKKEMADKYTAYIGERFIDNLTPENILARCEISPIDIEKWSPNMYRGDLLGPVPTISQSLSYRPLPELSDYRTPVEGLYLCGAATHPMGGMAAGGRATVQVIMEDMGIDFDSVIQ